MAFHRAKRRARADRVAADSQTRTDVMPWLSIVNGSSGAKYGDHPATSANERRPENELTAAEIADTVRPSVTQRSLRGAIAAVDNCAIWGRVGALAPTRSDVLVTRRLRRWHPRPC